MVQFKDYTLLLFALCLSLGASFAQPLSFTWSMDEHFDECAKAYNAVTHEYDKNILKPREGWVVRFELNNPTCANCTYTWNIKGTGAYSNYNRVYTTNLLKLFAINPIENSTQIGSINVGVSNKSGKKITAKDRSDTLEPKMKMPGNGQPQTGVPKPTAKQVERFPGIGSYVVTVTAKQNGSSGVQTFKQTVTLTNYLIVCLGDSFNSGEGNPSFPGEPNRTNRLECSVESLATAWYANGYNDNTITLERPASWLEELAHRSLSSGAAIAARSVELNDPHSVVTFIDYATSGAQTGEGLLEPQYPWQTSGQIAEVKKIIGNTPVTALLLSIGINDLSFARMLQDATVGTLDENYKRDSPDVKLVRLDRSFNLVNDAIRRNINVKNILLTEYPWPIFSTETSDYSRGCELFDIVHTEDHIYGVTDEEALLFHQIGQDLSLKMKQQSAVHSWLFIDGIADAFKGHGYCSDNSYYVHAQESCLYLGNIRGTMHPNIAGHELIGRIIYDQLKDILLPHNRPNTK